MIFTALFLAALSPVDHGTSKLVEPGHNHDWAVLDENSDGMAWWDRNLLLSQTVDGAEYPVILVRAVPVAQEYSFAYADVFTAIDCAKNQSASLDAYAEGGSLIEPVKVGSQDASFGDLPSPDGEGTIKMMRAVCGEDWTNSYEPS